MFVRSVGLGLGIAIVAACTGKDEARPADTTSAAPTVVSLTATEYAIEPRVSTPVTSRRLPSSSMS